MRCNLSALVTALLIFCPGKAGAEPGTVLRVADAHPCGEVVSFDGGWTCPPSTDGGTLPPGWWVSQPQMVKLGAKLTEKENEVAVLRAQNIEVTNQLQVCRDTPCPSAPSSQSGGATTGVIVFLVGLAAGMAAAFGVFWLVAR